jgi:hypothetical protein
MIAARQLNENYILQWKFRKRKGFSFSKLTIYRTRIFHYLRNSPISALVVFISVRFFSRNKHPELNFRRINKFAMFSCRFTVISRVRNALVLMKEPKSYQSLETALALSQSLGGKSVDITCALNIYNNISPSFSVVYRANALKIIDNAIAYTEGCTAIFLSCRSNAKEEAVDT